MHRAKDGRPICSYDPGCYRTNPAHLAKYAHPSREGRTSPPLPSAPSHCAPSSAVTPHVASPRKQATLDLYRTAPKEPWSAHAPVVSVPPPKPATPSPLSPSRPAVAAAQPLQSVPSSPSKDRKRLREEETSDTRLGGPLLAPPPRCSPLCGGLFDVYEMPFPVKELEAILSIARELNPSAPLTAFPGVRLVGPFEVILGRTFASDAEKWRAWRFRWDPPEVQTVAVSQRTERKGTSAAELPATHLGFHRDDPRELPQMVVRGSAFESTFTIEGSSLGAALSTFVEQQGDPAASYVARRLKDVFGEADKADAVQKRRKKTLGKTFHGLAFSIPYNRKTEIGYREPLLSDSQLHSLLSVMNRGSMTPKQDEAMDEQLRLADIANDESDFGLSLQLGLNFFSSVVANNAVLWNAQRMLDVAYMLLGRDLFRHILQCHMRYLADGVSFVM